MKKKVAVLAVDPVNGAGLFQYLESFYEKGISYKVLKTISISNFYIANVRIIFDKYVL